MVKKQKIICIDEDLHIKLEGINASGLINNLLGEYFGADNTENLAIIRAEIKKLMQERAIFSKKIKYFKQKVAKIQEKNDLEKQKLMKESEKQERKREVEAIKQKYFSGEITEDEYMDFFKN